MTAVAAVKSFRRELRVVQDLFAIYPCLVTTTPRELPIVSLLRFFHCRSLCEGAGLVN